MVKGALDDDRILGGVIALLMLAVAGLLVGVVLWTADADLPPIAAVEHTGAVEPSAAPSVEGPTDDTMPFTSRGRVAATF